MSTTSSPYLVGSFCVDLALVMHMNFPPTLTAGARGLGGAAVVEAVCVYMADFALPEVVKRLFDLTCYWEKQ